MCVCVSGFSGTTFAGLPRVLNIHGLQAAEIGRGVGREEK
jgi:hypothetical protein